jgi:hypothetical protein
MSIKALDSKILHLTNPKHNSSNMVANYHKFSKTLRKFKGKEPMSNIGVLALWEREMVKIGC